MHLTKKEIKKIYSLLQSEIVQIEGKVSDEYLLNKIISVATYQQIYNFVYSDVVLEDTLHRIAKRNLKVFPYKRKKERAVFFDDWCVSYVLALQYVEAMCENFDEVLYITTRDTSELGNNSILRELSTFSKVKILVLAEPIGKIVKAQKIIDAILAFEPDKLFTHVGYASDITLALYALKNIVTTYFIDLNDHLFWLGAKAIDYLLVFRQWGTAVAIEKRGLRKEQLLYLPYYPIIDKQSFQGFPKEAQGKVVIFTGGDFYKTISPDFRYWHFCKRILQENENVVILYAMKASLPKAACFIDDFIRENGLEGRLIPIGFRKDISQVYAHADIFLGTFPMCGGLSSQLAAMNNTAILQYYFPDTYYDETEQNLCYNDQYQISFHDEESFMQFAKRLINDEKFRKDWGNRAYRAMFSRQQFNQRFSYLMETHDTACPIQYNDYEAVFGFWYWGEQMEFRNTLQYSFSLLSKKKVLIKMPPLATRYYCSRCVDWIIRKIK